jgi:hypothetical protein
MQVHMHVHVQIERATKLHLARNGIWTAGCVGVTWPKSKYSDQLSDCMEAATLDRGEVAIRKGTSTLATETSDSPGAGSQRCGSVLKHINGLAEDGEWHCHLPESHDGVCRAPDGTIW